MTQVTYRTCQLDARGIASLQHPAVHACSVFVADCISISNSIFSQSDLSDKRSPRPSHHIQWTVAFDALGVSEALLTCLQHVLLCNARVWVASPYLLPSMACTQPSLLDPPRVKTPFSGSLWLEWLLEPGASSLASAHLVPTNLTW